MSDTGRPLKYETAEELQVKIDEYIDICSDIDNPKPLTYTGLAYHLGFASRQSIWEYSKRTDELSLPIKRAMLRIEQSYEEALHGNSPTGSIFALKNRGWRDKQEIAFDDVKKPDMSRYSKEELKQLAELNRKSRS